MRRRRVLASLGAAAGLGLAGCTAGGREGAGRTTTTQDRTTTDRTTTTDPTTTTTVTDDLAATHRVGTIVELPDGRNVGVLSVRVRDAVVYPGPWMTQFAGGSDRQYVEATTVPEHPGDSDDHPRGPSAFSLVLDGEIHEQGLDRSPARIGQYGRDNRALFEVGTDLAPASGAVVWSGDDVPDQRFELSEEALRAIRLEPSFAVESFAVSDRARPAGEDGTSATVDVSVTVANDGERDGIFVGLLDLPSNEGVADYHPTRRLSATVPRGGRTTLERTVTWSMPPDDSGSVGLTWSGSNRSASVSFVDVGDPL